MSITLDRVSRCADWPCNGPWGRTLGGHLTSAHLDSTICETYWTGQPDGARPPLLYRTPTQLITMLN